MKTKNSLGKVPASDPSCARAARRKTRFAMLSAAVLVLLAAATAQAAPATLYWDTGTTSGLTPGNGTWDIGTTSNWATAAVPGTTAPSTWVDNSYAYIQTGGTYTITLSGSVTTSGIQISGSNGSSSVNPTTVTITGGTLALDNTAGAGSGNLISVVEPATVTINSAVLLSGSATNHRNIMNIGYGGHLVINGNITETLGSVMTFRVFGTDVTLSGTNSFTGGLQIDNASTVILANTASSGTGAILFGKAGTYTTGQQLIANLATSGTFANALLFAGVITGTTAPEQVSILSNGAAVTFTSNTLFTGGAGLSALGSSKVPLSLILGGTSTDANTYAGVISDAGPVASGSITTLTKQGSGKWILSGSNTYTGATTISAGELDVNGSLAASSTVSVAAGATLGGSGTAAGNVIVSSGTINGSKLLIAGSGTFTGLSTLSGVNTINGGATAASGTLTIASGTTTAALAVANGAQATNNGLLNGAVTVNAGGVLNGSGTMSSAVTNSGTISGSLTFNNDVTVNSGATAAASAFNGNITNNGSITSSVTVQSGKTLSGSGTNAAVAVQNGTVNGNGLNLGATTFDGQSTLSGTTTASSVTINSGTTSASGVNTSNGNLSVSAGSTLKNTGSFSANIVTVANTATLTNNGTVTGTVNVSGLLNGTGTITGALTIKTAGELAPGNSPGMTTVAGSLTVETGAKISMQIEGTTTAGTDYDQIIVTGASSLVTLNAGSVLNLTISDGVFTSGALTLIENQSDNAIVGTFSAVLISGSTYDVSTTNKFTYNGKEYELLYNVNADSGSTANDLELTVVPEPGTWAMLVGGLTMLFGAQRKRRRSA